MNSRCFIANPAPRYSQPERKRFPVQVQGIGCPSWVIRDWGEMTADQAISGITRLLPVLACNQKSCCANAGLTADDRDELVRQGDNSVCCLGRMEGRMEMRAVQPCHRPIPPPCLGGRMIMDCRGLNEARRHMIPVGKLYDVFEPFDREPRQPDFELR